MRKDFNRVHLTSEGTVAVITLNHPEVVNAISPKMVHGFFDALAFVNDKANGFRAVVLTGEGRGFSSGANLAEPPEAGEVPDAGLYLDKYYHPLLFALRALDMPLVTAVNGAAAGIGMSIALMGDLVFASRSAFFQQAFARIGLVPDGGSTWILPRLIGLARARELSLLAERLPAETALGWGLINRVCDDAALRDEALSTASRLAEGPTLALTATRRLFWASPDNSWGEQLAMEKTEQSRAGKTEDFREGIIAFLKKRPPKFNGR
jgi:2-(1,2-epoxy-1,2-dihydrophenyl)acetyl-CoA isomerase